MSVNCNGEAPGCRVLPPPAPALSAPGPVGEGEGAGGAGAGVQGCRDVCPWAPLACVGTSLCRARLQPQNPRLTEYWSASSGMCRLLIYILDKGRINTNRRAVPLGDVTPHGTLLRVSHLPTAWQVPSCTTWPRHKAPSSFITQAPSSSLLLSLTAGPGPGSAPHLLSVLLPHLVSSLLCLLLWPNAAARAKGTALGGTQTFLSMLFAWSWSIRISMINGIGQTQTHSGRAGALGLSPASYPCGRHQALTPDPVEQALFSASRVLKSCSSPGCTQTQMIILSWQTCTASSLYLTAVPVSWIRKETLDSCCFRGWNICEVSA